MRPWSKRLPNVIAVFMAWNITHPWKVRMSSRLAMPCRWAAEDFLQIDSVRGTRGAGHADTRDDWQLVTGS